MNTKNARTISLIILGIVAVVSAIAIEPFTATKSVMCADTRSTFESISAYASEAPVWAGQDSHGKYVLLENNKTRTWTMIYYDAEFACVVAAGTNATPIFTDQ